MTNIDWFRFEDKNLDFPIYKKNPHVPKWGWIVLFLVSMVGLLFSISSRFHINFLSCLIVLIPLLYFLKWDYKAIFQKPSLKDVGLAVLLFAGYILYAYAMSAVLENFGIVSSGVIDEYSVTIMTTIPIVFTIMTEELIKFVPFIFFLRVGYKYTNNRKLSVAVSVFLVMIGFASLHAYNFNMFIFAIFIQGFGSIFEFIGYIKTKNILVSYITHLCTDILAFSIVLLGL